MLFISATHLFDPQTGDLYFYDPDGCTMKRVNNFPPNMISMELIDYNRYYILDSNGSVFIARFNGGYKGKYFNIEWASDTLKFSKITFGRSGSYVFSTPDHYHYLVNREKLVKVISTPAHYGELIAADKFRTLIFKGGQCVNYEGKHFDTIDIGRDPILLVPGQFRDVMITSEEPDIIQKIHSRDGFKLPESVVVAISTDFNFNTYWISETNKVGMTDYGDTFRSKYLLGSYLPELVDLGHIGFVGRNAPEYLILKDIKDKFYCHNINDNVTNKMIVT